MAKVAVLGIGIMGRGMALSLLRKGHEVTVWNRTRDRAEELSGQGASVADTPRQAAEGKDFVITMLSSPEVVEEIAFGESGLIEGLGQGAVYIDCSTVDPMTSAVLAQAAAEKDAGFLDSPVGGSRAAAESGELILMVGGDDATFEKARPILEALASKIIRAGETTMGSYLKLCFNLIVSHMSAALAEVLVFGAKSGLDPQLVLDTINTGTIGSRFYDWKGGCILDRDFTTNFSVNLMHKDLNLIMNAAYGLNVPLPVTASVKELFATAKSCCDPEEDFCAVVRALESVTHFEVTRK